MAWSATDPLWAELHGLAVAYAAGSLEKAGEDRLFGVLLSISSGTLVRNWQGRIRPDDIDEIGAQMWPAIIRAMRRFDAEQTHFSTYFYNLFIKQQYSAMKVVFAEHRRAVRAGVRVSSMPDDEDSRAAAPPVGMMPFSEMIAPLDDRLRCVFSRYYVDELTLQEIGPEIGVTKQRVHQLLERGHGALRFHWGSREALRAA